MYILNDDDPSRQKPHSFLIITHSDRYHIAGIDEKQALHWFDIIVKQIKKIEAERDLDQRSISSIRKTIDKGPRTRTASKLSMTDRQMIKERSIAITRIFKVLLALQTQESEIWEGESFIIPVLLHFSRILVEASSPNELCLIDIQLPKTIEFNGILNKIFRVHPYSTINSIKQKICVTYNVYNHHDFTLVTLKNNALKDEAPISAYGIGCILKIWKLKLVKKQDLHISTHVSMPKVDLSLNLGDMYPVLLLFTDSKFGSTPCLRTLLYCDMTTDRAIASICSQYGVSDSENYSFSTIDGKRLPKSYTFRSLGLGTRFRDWELMLAHDQFFELDKDNDQVPGQQFLWTNYDDSLTLDEAKEIISKLDSEMAEKISIAKESISTLREQINTLNMKVQELETENEIVKMNLEQKADEISDMIRRDSSSIEIPKFVNELDILEDTEMTYIPHLADKAQEVGLQLKVNQDQDSAVDEYLWSHSDTKIIDSHFDPLNRSLNDYYTDNASDILKFMKFISDESIAYENGLEDLSTSPSDSAVANDPMYSEDVQDNREYPTVADDDFSMQLLSRIEELENKINSTKSDKNDSDADDIDINKQIIDLNFGIPADQLFNSIEEMLAYEEEQAKKQNQLVDESKNTSFIQNNLNQEVSTSMSSSNPEEGFVNIDELIKDGDVLIKEEDNTFSRNLLNNPCNNNNPIQTDSKDTIETPVISNRSASRKNISIANDGPSQTGQKELKVAQSKLSKLPTPLSKQKSYCDLQRSLESRSLSFKETDVVNIAHVKVNLEIEWKIEAESLKDVEVLKIF